MISIYSKLKAIGKKEENKELLLHSLFALIVRIGGAIASFLMNIVIARYLGAAEAGYFFLAVTITTLVASIGRIGADQTVLRFVSLHSEYLEWDKVHALMKKLLSWTYLPLIGLAALGCIFSKQISLYFFNKPELQMPLFWTCLSMPFFAGYNVLGMALQGRKKVILSVTALKILTPLFLIIIAFGFSPKNASYASIYYTIACIANLFFAYYWWNKNVPKASTFESYDSSKLWQSCSHLWVSSIMQQINVWGGQLVAGIFVASAQVAQLAVARNTAVLIAFILMAVNNVSAPRFVSMYSQGKMKQLQNYVRNTTWLMTAVALPITLVIWIFPSYIMSLFGKDFVGGEWLLRILAAGQFINVITGSVGSLLIMTGHEKDLRNNRIINGVMAIGLALILTPIFGAVGSALSSAISLAFFNLLGVRLIKKRLGISTIVILGLRKN
jgi:O-antigen/teichoic acid export membrane protein